MSTHNICIYGELMKIILQLSSNTHLICSGGSSFKHLLIDKIVHESLDLDCDSCKLMKIFFMELAVMTQNKNDFRSSKYF